MVAYGALRVTKVTPTYWRATMCKGPVNIFGPELYADLRLLLDDLEKDNQVRVLVLDSDVPDFFCAHWDLTWPTGDDEPVDMPGYVSAIGDWANFVHRLTNIGVVSIASVRGRARGHGSEPRTCTRHSICQSQPEVGAGVVPGGGGTEWLPLLCGRSRALEILLASDDFDASTAELYGWINRAIPDAELDQFVDKFACRIAGFNKFPLFDLKRAVNQRVGIPSHADMYESQQLFVRCTTAPSSQHRLKQMFEAGLQQRGEAEKNLGQLLAQIKSDK
ncbi:ClpP/crotonase-like domain-containing protein [Xylogone sp. PMI_703]|nr:ClpP/crotonase-like domain-containing protein [Xylogone sp. PMI_703]